MSIFDAGFIMWGYFLLYALIVAAYITWMIAKNRSESRKTSQHGTPTGDQS